MYYVTSGYSKPDQTQAFKEWIQSAEHEDLAAAVEAETGVRYVETYFPILGFGEYTYEIWWELPDWGALDDLRRSEAGTEMIQQMLTFVDQSRSGTARALRTAADVKVTEPDDGGD